MYNTGPRKNSSGRLPPKNGKKGRNKNKNWQHRVSLVFCEGTRFLKSISCVLFLLSDIILGEIEQKPYANFSRVLFLFHDR